MTRLLKLTFFLPFACLLFVSTAGAQSPYPSLKFAREPNSEGSTDYMLRPTIAEIRKKVGGNDKPFQLVGALARQANQSAVLIFVNAQPEIQFRPETDTNVVITFDSVDVRNLKYELAASNESEGLKLQIANVLISLKDLQTIAKGESVVLKLGPVVYRVEHDNLNAIRYLVSEIEKDLRKGL